MALLELDVEFDTGFVNELFKAIPELSGGFLAFVGSRSRTLLKQQLLSGQEINLMNRKKDAIGRYLISSDVNKKRTETKIYSYPVNLFEEGRGLRDGSREAGKFIITQKLKQLVSMNMANYISKYDRMVQKDFDKI